MSKYKVSYSLHNPESPTGEGLYIHMGNGTIIDFKNRKLYDDFIRQLESIRDELEGQDGIHGARNEFYYT